METIRKSNRSDARASRAFAGALVVLLAGSGCRPFASAPPPSERGVVPRKPDGVALDLPPAIPGAADRAAARGVVTLREPMGDEAVQGIVRAYVAAFLREDVDALAELLTSDATSLNPKPAGGAPRAALLDGWRTRFRNLDYAKLAGSEIVDYDGLERYGVDDLSVTNARVPRPASMQAGDLLLRVPVVTTLVAGERYFGDFVTMVLRRDQGRFLIAAVGEEDAP